MLLTNSSIVFRWLSVCTLFIWASFIASPQLRAAEAMWKAGVAISEIAPTNPQWMSGYAARDRLAEGTLHPLYINILALEDEAGRRAIVMSSDLLGMPQTIYGIRGQPAQQFRGQRAQAPSTRWMIRPITQVTDTVKASVKSFLFQVARRLALDVLRHDRASPVEVAVNLDIMPAAEERAGVSDTVSTSKKFELLIEAIATLPARCREVVVLRNRHGT